MRKSMFSKLSMKKLAAISLSCFIPTFMFAESNISVLSDVNLTGESYSANNYIRLDWSLADTKNKTYKVFQKKPGSTEFQSISSTNFNSAKQVKVLNIHPNAGETISFTTWDGENITIPKSGNLKQWMEVPNSENPKGYGQGIIEVTSVTIDSFNSNPTLYLKNGDGSWKYDVVYLGHWDANNEKIPNQTAIENLKAFILSGRGFLAGHDTIGYNYGTNSGLGIIRDLFNIKVGYWNNPGTTPTDENHHYFAGFTSTKVVLQKKGLLTNYPWNIGEIGSEFNIPSTHSTSNFAYGDIWLTFDGVKWNEVGGVHNAPSSLDKYNNFYLTTWNNTAMIQTGHSKGSATSDEQKLMANTLFYLNQLSVDTYLNDYSGQDINAPEVPNIKILKSTSSQLKFNFDSSKDIGSEYSYYVIAEDKNNGVYQSNTITKVIKSGIKGYSYILDQNPTTIPSNNINHTDSDLTINNIETGKSYYLHIKAIDNVGNIGETVHYKIDTSKPLSPNLNLSRAGWGTDNVSFNLTQPHNKNLKIISISPSLNDHYVAKLKSLGYSIVDKQNYTNIEDILSYDLVIYDIGGLGVGNGVVLKELYDRGAKIITVGNDSDSSIYPITGYTGVDNVDLTINRAIKNEATFNLPSLGGGRDSYSILLTSVVSEANILYRNVYNNGPSIFEIQNGKGGRWIHSQKMLGLNDSENSDEFSMGIVDYITDYISQIHLSDTQYKINNGEWISYNGGIIPISQEGSYTVSIRNVDNRGVYSDVVTKTVGIDRTAPYLTATTPTITKSRNITVYLNGMGDSLSGVESVRVSNYSDFRDASTYTKVSGQTSANLIVTIPFFADLNQNYSTRTIYVQLLDSVGNSKVVSCTTKYEAKEPEIPIINSPKVNSLYVDNSSVNISWIYNDINNDGVKLPQGKAILTLTNIETNEVYKYVVNGSGYDFIVHGLKDGAYTVTVEVFNSFLKSTVSKPVTFRYNYYNSSGYVVSKSISTGTSIAYVNIINLYNLPKNTSIDGYVYYASKNTDSFVDNKRVKFLLTNVFDGQNVIKLPEKSEKIMVKLILSNKNTNNFITPSIDNIIIYGR